MGAKTTESTSSYAPAKQAMDIYNSIYGRAQDVASKPYEAYQGQLTAPLSGTQQAGISNVNASQGIANPYLNQASQYGAAGAAPVNNLSQNDIQQYMNPYQQSVIQSTLANIGENNAQQQQQVLGNAAMKGALGGDRVGVAQAELARQQNLATNQTLAGLNSQNYSQAMQTAQGQQQNQQQNANRQAQAAYTFGNLGTTAQNTALQGAGAQLQAGGLEQQTQQQADTAAYNQFMQKQAFPYQQTGWLAGIGLPIAGSVGGTQTQTQPGPNPWSQIGGAALATAGMFLKDGGRVGYAEGGSTPFNFISDAQGWIPHSAALQANAVRPTISKMTDPNAATNAGIMSGLKGLQGTFGGMGSVTPSVNMGGGQGAADSMEGAQWWNRGGRVAEDDGLVSAVHKIRKGLMKANGGEVENFNDRWSPVPEAIASGQFDPQGSNNMPVQMAQSIPMPQPRPLPPQLPPQITNPDGLPQNGMPPSAMGFNPQPTTPMSFGELPTEQGATQDFSAQPRQANGKSGLFNLSDEQRQGLLAAGLGMLGGTSPFAGVNIGQGGLKGVEAMSAFRKEQQNKKEKAEQLAIQRMGVEQRGKQLAQQAEQFAKTFGETKRQHDVTQMQPVKIGTGLYGDIYGIRDPKTGTIIPIDPKTGRPQSESIPGSPPIGPQSAVDPEEQLPAGARPVQFMTLNDPVSGQFNTGVLDGADKGLDATVKSIAEGRRAPLSLGRNNQYNRTVMERVQQYNPAYDATMFPSRQRTINAFKAGTEGKNVTSLNTVGQHLEELYNAAKDLDNTRVPMFNKAKQFIGWETGNKDYQDKMKAYKVAADAVAVEAAKAFMGGGQTALADREEWGKLFNISDPLNAQASAIRKTVKLLDGRINALASQYNQGMSTTHEPFQLLQPKTREAFDRLRSIGEEKPAAPAVKEAAPTVGSGNAGQIAVGTEKQFKQGIGVWDGTKWVPKPNAGQP